MIKAKLRNEDRYIVSVDPSLSHGEAYSLAHQQLLICPGCQAEVRFNHGSEEPRRRPFFFHRALLECHYGGDPEVERARAALYTFLKGKVDIRGGQIDVEVRLPGAPKDDLVDVWVAFPGSMPIGYRILKAGPKPGRLTKMVSATEQSGATARFLLTLSRRRWEDPPLDEGPRLDIPSYDRRLLFEREWDKFHQLTFHPVQSQSLLYIDPDQEQLVLYRDVNNAWDCNIRIHTFAQEHKAPISEVRITKTGDLVFPDEVDQKQRWETWAEKERARQQREAERQASAARARRAAEEARRARAQAEAEKRERAIQEFRNRLPEIEASWWAALPAEGLRILDGQVPDLPHPDIYRRPPAEWVPLLVGFAFRAGIPFTVTESINWLWQSVGCDSSTPTVRQEQDVQIALWQELSRRGLVKLSGRETISPSITKEVFHWSTVRPTPTPLGMCITCRRETDLWVAYDPQLGVCKCISCFGRMR